MNKLDQDTRQLFALLPREEPSVAFRAAVMQHIVRRRLMQPLMPAWALWLFVVGVFVLPIGAVLQQLGGWWQAPQLGWWAGLGHVYQGMQLELAAAMGMVLLLFWTYYFLDEVLRRVLRA